MGFLATIGICPLHFNTHSSTDHKSALSINGKQTDCAIQYPFLTPMELVMDNYPEKTCSIDRLVTHPKLVAATLAGTKTEQRRNGVYGYPNEEFALEGVTFVVTGLIQQRLGDMTDQDAQAEGYPTLAMYKDIILKMHTGMSWDDDGVAWVHSFAIKN